MKGDCRVGVMTQPFDRFDVGQTVYEFRGATYGCIVWGVEIPVTAEPGVHPFIGVPLDAVAWTDGYAPRVPCPCCDNGRRA